MSAEEWTVAPVSRRGFLVGATLTASGLLIGIGGAGRAWAAAPFTPNAFIRIPAEGKVVLVMSSVEMGQGIYTAMAMLIAEELEVPLDQVTLEHAPADPGRYANPLLGDQITGRSLAIRGIYEPMRLAGATARMMLVNAAARQWGVDPADCRAETGAVLHDSSGRRATYGQLVEAAAEPVPQDVPLKPASDFKVIGQVIRRLDAPEKVNGTAKFGIDARPQGLSYAAIAICPHFNGTLRGVEDSETFKIKGVKQVVRIRNAVAVVADNTWTAMKGLAALSVDWDPGASAGLTTAELERRIEAAIDGPALPFVDEGDVATAEAEHGPGGRIRLSPLDPAAQHHGADELHRACARGRLRGLDRHPGSWAAPARRSRTSWACRSRKCWCTITSWAAASAAGWTSTASSSPPRSPGR